MNFLHKLIEWVKGVLSESDGTPSSLRHAFVVGEIVIWMSCVATIGYAIYSHFHGKPNSAPFDPSHVLIGIGSLLTINRAAKVAQKNMEADPPNNPPVIP